MTPGLWNHSSINIFHPEGCPKFQSCMVNGFDIHDLSALQTQHVEKQSPHISYLETPAICQQPLGYFTGFINTLTISLFTME